MAAAPLQLVPVQDAGDWLCEFRHDGRKDPVAYTEWVRTPGALQDVLRRMASALVQRFKDDPEFLQEVKAALLDGLPAADVAQVEAVGQVARLPAAPVVQPGPEIGVPPRMPDPADEDHGDAETQEDPLGASPAEAP